jgi:hypothetical protein
MKEAEIVQHIICCCEALARQRFNVFAYLVVELPDIRTASVKDLYLFIRGMGLHHFVETCMMQERTQQENNRK